MYLINCLIVMLLFNPFILGLISIKPNRFIRFNSLYFALFNVYLVYLLPYINSLIFLYWD